MSFDKNKYDAEFVRLNYDRFSLRAPKGRKAEIKKAAEAAGMSLNEYIMAAIAEKEEREMGNEVKRAMANTGREYEDILQDVRVLQSAQCNRTIAEACHDIERGTVVYEAEDLRRHLEEYVEMFDEEEAEDFRAMVSGGDCIADWERTTCDGVEYLIQYVC